MFDSFSFEIFGRPLVQKNNIKIRQKRVKGGRTIPFIDHSNEMKKVRESITEFAYSEYISQGFTEPIDFLVEVYFLFFVDNRSKPDLDNLPSIVLDALQGKKQKGKKERLQQVLIDDSLVRYITAEKIVKGDNLYYGEPRTVVELRRYCPRGAFSASIPSNFSSR